MRILLATAMVFLAIGTVAAQSRITNEEYEIYGLVLTEFFREANRRNPDDTQEHFVIASKTMAVDPATVEKGHASLYKSFNDRNKVRASLERRFPVRFSYSMADEREILVWVAQDEAEYVAAQERLRTEGKPLNGGPCGAEWKRFYSRFPKSFGYYQLSRIGFSRDHRWAYLEIKGRGSSWDEDSWYWLRWTRRGWKTYRAGGGFGVC